MRVGEPGSESPSTMIWLRQRKQRKKSSRSSGSLQGDILVNREGRLARKGKWCTINS